ncbi:hypothetical protein BU24DRAFT_420983 [Aaosphaeria arxii CBS 175.79]|uniref:Zn(2)-C6 fungal-type domain-containing protein n=1 Tax=Aaosphaeria arxii CBS 175.79 TaxID=1450172 RepID=A0A6A5XX94_9PLEO|nr:uncharacterized protein BU24DRAFT_420983 [Aaosphaeria arxii CBS 175.79]KAF2017938.1 hypothetical protein BU24DRAFT_420983 [Aaosphaeria arxii CBS 175.79]
MDEAAARKRASINEARRQRRKPRGQGLRKRTGCATCKRRHLRCDEATPECGQCVKSKQTCVYANSNSKSRSPIPAVAVEPPPTDQDGNDEEDTQRSSPSSQAVVENHQGTNNSEVTPGSTTLSNISNQPCLPEAVNCTYIPEIPPDAALSRWLGLLANDAVSGDPSIGFLRGMPTSPDAATHSQQSPSFGDNIAFDTLGQQYSFPIEIAHRPPGGSVVNEEAPSNPWLDSRPNELSNFESALFHNFVTEVSSWIDLHDPCNHFALVVPHLAMRDSGLMNAILALSSRQLSISHNATPEEQDSKIGIQYYYKTLHYLQKAMYIEEYTTSLELLATALIVSMYEMLDDSGTGSGWERHLKGVFWIQRSKLIQGETGGLRSAVWWAWLRQDIWAGFRERRRTLSLWTPTKSYTTMTSFEKAARVVWIFAKAVDYCSADAMKDGVNNVKLRLDSAEKITAMLDEWRDNLSDEFTPLPYHKQRQQQHSIDGFDPIWIHPPSFAVSMQLNYAARILVLLHKPSLGGATDYMEQQKVLTAYSTIICQLAIPLTDAASSVMSSQCLYIAGLCIQDTKHREAVVGLIDGCHRRVGWPRVSLSVDLREQWAKTGGS